jgi:hypothetical protein
VRHIPAILAAVFIPALWLLPFAGAFAVGAVTGGLGWWALAAWIAGMAVTALGQWFLHARY